MCGAMRSCAAQIAFQSGAVLLAGSAVGVALISVRFLGASLSRNYGIAGCIMPAPESSFRPSTLARSTRADQALLFLAAFLRSLVIGMTGVLLAIPLSSSGWDIKTIGTLVTAGLAGNPPPPLFTTLLSPPAA